MLLAAPSTPPLEHTIVACVHTSATDEQCWRWAAMSSKSLTTCSRNQPLTANLELTTSIAFAPNASSAAALLNFSALTTRSLLRLSPSLPKEEFSG